MTMSALDPLDWRMYYVRDRYRAATAPVAGQVERLGEIDQFAKATFVLRLNDIGSFVIDSDPQAAGIMAAINDIPYNDLARNIELVINGRRVFLGPIQGYERRLDTTHEQVTLFGADQNVWLAQRVAHAVPAWNTSPRTFSDATPPVWPGQAPIWCGAYQNGPADHRPNDNFVGPAGQAITWYVHGNLGPGAGIPERRHIWTALPGPNLGLPVTISARFQNLLELIQGIAVEAGDWPLAFRVDAWGLNVWQPADRGAIFSTDVGNIASYLGRVSVDDLNMAYVAGQGEGEERMFALNPGYGGITTGGPPIDPVFPGLVQPPIFGRVEAFRDRRDTDEWPTLQGAAVADTRAGIKRPQVLVTALDTPTQRFGVDYGLGDIVTVRFAGQDLKALVTALTFSLEPGRPPTVTPTLGTEVAVAPLGFIRRIDQSNTRLNQLERR